jgi:hypothetical protein
MNKNRTGDHVRSQEVADISRNPHRSTTHAMACACTDISGDEDISSSNTASLARWRGTKPIATVPSNCNRSSPHSHADFLANAPRDNESSSSEIGPDPISRVPFNNQGSSVHPTT